MRRWVGTSSCFGKDIDPLIGIGDHHVAVEETAVSWHGFTQGRHDRRTDCDVGDCQILDCTMEVGKRTKMTVHDVDVQPVCAIIYDLEI